MIVFPLIIQEQLISSSFCKILGWSILIQSFAKFIMGDILADTAILGNASKKEPLCSCYEHTSRACLQLDGMAAEKEGFVWQDRSEQIIRYSNDIRILFDLQIFVFVFGHKLKPEYYSCSHSSKNLGPNIIHIRIRPKIWVRILFVFVFISFWK